MSTILQAQPPPQHRNRIAMGTLLALTALLGFSAHAEATDAPASLSKELSGRELYQRVIDNQLTTSEMEQRTISEDPGGDRQESRFWSRFKDYRVDGQANADGVISKAIMKYTFPQSRRDSGYLFIENHRRENEGYQYSRFRGKVMRMRTREETVFGTDFTLEDIVAARVLDDATYERGPDEVLDGEPVYVVTATYVDEALPQYARSRLWIDPQTFVPLRILNWSHDDVERNMLEVKREHIERHDTSFVPMEVKMTDLRDQTASWLYVDAINANPGIPDTSFEPVRIGRNRR